MSSFSLHAIIRANMVQHDSVWPEEGLEGWNALACICALTAKLAMISYGLLKLSLPEIFQDDDQVTHADSVVAEHTHWSPMCPMCSLTDSLSFLLQHVRLLSRKQFQLRALMQKARKTAGLSDLYWPVVDTWKWSYLHVLFLPFFILLFSFCFFFL